MGYDQGYIDIKQITGGVVNFEGALVVSPKSASKSAYGAGSNNTAAFIFNLTDASSTNTNAVDSFDQPVSGNI